MTKILVIGNSHVGAIKTGLDLLPPPDCLDFDFIALPGTNYKLLNVIDGQFSVPERFEKFVCDTFSFQEPPSLGDYDFFLFCADRCRLSIDLYTDNREPPVLSESVIDAIIHNVKGHLYQQIADCSRPAQLVLIGAPLLSENAYQDKYLQRIPIVRSEQDIRNLEKLESLIRKCCDQSLQQAGTARFLLPPRHVLTQHGFCTDDQYIRGGIRVDGRKREKGKSRDFETNMRHGNERYGVEIAKILTAFFTAVS